MDRLTLAAPWHIPEYLPYHLYESLYHALFDFDEDQEPSINLLDESKFLQAIEPGTYTKNLKKNIKRFKKNKRKPPAFLEANALNSLYIIENLPGDIEFHHSVPMTSGTRPFILHCESPAALLAANSPREQALFCYYKKRLEETNCLGVFSHLSETLLEIKKNFNSPKITQKLFLTSIGLQDSIFNQLTKLKKKPIDIENPIFLAPEAGFLNDQWLALSFATHYCSTSPGGVFIFQGSPPDYRLADKLLEAEKLLSLEDSGRLFWTGTDLSEKEECNLFKAADFCLHTAPKLASVTIMKAQAAGVIPISTKATGIDFFICDKSNGVVLHTPSAHSIYNAIKDLLGDPKKIQALSNNAQKKAISHYSGKVFRESFFRKVMGLHKAGGAKKSTQAHPCPALSSSLETEKVNDLLHQSPAPKLLASLGRYFFWKSRGVFLATSEKNTSTRNVSHGKGCATLALTQRSSSRLKTSMHSNLHALLCGNPFILKKRGHPFSDQYRFVLCGLLSRFKNKHPLMHTFIKKRLPHNILDRMARLSLSTDRLAISISEMRKTLSLLPPLANSNKALDIFVGIERNLKLFYNIRNLIFIFSHPRIILYSETHALIHFYNFFFIIPSSVDPCTFSLSHATIPSGTKIFFCIEKATKHMYFLGYKEKNSSCYPSVPEPLFSTPLFSLIFFKKKFFILPSSKKETHLGAPEKLWNKDIKKFSSAKRAYSYFNSLSAPPPYTSTPRTLLKYGAYRLMHIDSGFYLIPSTLDYSSIDVRYIHLIRAFDSFPKALNTFLREGKNSISLYSNDSVVLFEHARHKIVHFKDAYYVLPQKTKPTPSDFNEKKPLAYKSLKRALQKIVTL